MAQESGRSFTDILIESAFAIGVPLARKELGIESPEQSVTREKIELGNLNGTGPVDKWAALKSPKTMMEFAFGQGPSNQSGSSVVSSAGPSWILIGGLALLAMFGIILVFRK